MATGVAAASSRRLAINSVTTQTGQARLLAAELLEDIELSRVNISAMVLKALRLARLVGDEEAMLWLGFEADGIPNNDVGQAHMTSTGRWTDRSKAKGWWASASELADQVVALNRMIDASRVDSLSTEHALLALREQRSAIADLTSRVMQINGVLSRVQSRIHGFTRSVAFELEFSEQQRTLFEASRHEVDALLAAHAGEALSKVESIYKRLSEGDPEAVSQAMNTCRRLIDGFADAVYPPVANGTAELDGVDVAIGPEHTRNRIGAYLGSVVESTTRRKRLRRTLADLYKRVSSGVHSDISANEARFLFLSTYVFLGEILVAAHDPARSSDDGSTS